jgi:hypothetical protein
MAINRWINNTGAEVAQVKTFTITADSTSNTAVWTFTLTMDDGSTATVTYTEDGSPTVAEIATGLFNAWNASTHPAIARITAANPSAGVVTLTADTAGVPFSVALADSDDGTHTETNTTANVGNNDYNTARNWSLNTVPASTNDVEIGGPTSGQSVSILYGLNQSAIDIAAFNVRKDYNGQIGREEDGKSYYLRIDPDTVDYQGASNLALIDIGSANISPQIECNGSALNGKFALYIKGSDIATLEVRKGKVAIAPLTGETATVATLLVSYATNPLSDSDVTIGSGVTLTTLTQSGGKVELRCAATTVTTGASGVCTTAGSGAITTWHAYGKIYPNSTGTITTLNLYGLMDQTGDRNSRTISTTNIKPGSEIVRVSNVTMSTINLQTDPGTFKYSVAV